MCRVCLLTGDVILLAGMAPRGCEGERDQSSMALAPDGAISTSDAVDWEAVRTAPPEAVRM